MGCPSASMAGPIVLGPSTTQARCKRGLRQFRSYDLQGALRGSLTSELSVRELARLPRSTEVLFGAVLKRILRSAALSQMWSRTPKLSVVRVAGVEPALLSELDFESSASTNSTTPAQV